MSPETSPFNDKIKLKSLFKEINVGWTSVGGERITFDRRLVAPTPTFSLEIQFDNNAM